MKLFKIHFQKYLMFIQTYAIIKIQIIERS
nr:MAG TPA: hypothetical protein [Caudoviricetes sp.]